MDNFKFLSNNRPTIQDLKDHAWRYSHQFRFHPIGCLISKSVYRTFVVGPINDGEITTFEQVEQLINECTLTPEEFIQRQNEFQLEEDYIYTLDLHQEEDPSFESM